MAYHPLDRAVHLMEPALDMEAEFLKTSNNPVFVLYQT